jgi:hypothetical protein
LSVFYAAPVVQITTLQKPKQYIGHYDNTCDITYNDNTSNT